MGLYTGVFRTVRITDRTLPEVLGGNGGLERRDILDLLSMLKGLGTAWLEIGPEVLKITGALPEGIEYLYRIEREQDLKSLSSSDFKKVILGMELPGSMELPLSPALRSKAVTLECRAETMEDLTGLKNRLRCAGLPGNVRMIRLLGLNGLIGPAWLEKAEEIKRTLDVKLDLCPENLYYSATAIAIDGMRQVVDHVTASFAGHGGPSGYAALEQVLTFIETLADPYAGMELGALPRLAAWFSEHTGVRIPENMPVIGPDIFRYESGIHADGILKDPATYEPFDPAVVGQCRRLSIGKHSGRKSVLYKLRELGIEAGETQTAELLERIRGKSILLHRDLRDDEILDLLHVRTAAAV